MRWRSLIATGGSLLVVGALAVASGCSKGTSPAPAAGGGTTNPSFSFDFASNGITHDFMFTTAGSWPYHCNFHSFMTGTVIVDAAAPNDTAIVSVGGGCASA